MSDTNFSGLTAALFIVIAALVGMLCASVFSSIDTERLAHMKEVERLEAQISRYQEQLLSLHEQLGMCVQRNTPDAKPKTTSAIPVSKDKLRMVNYGTNDSKPIKIHTHGGGEVLPYEDTRHTVEAVFQRLPNIKTTSELVDLVMETMIVETHLGGEKWETGIRKWRNYGIGQFVLSTAQYTLDWLKKQRPDVYDAVKSLYDSDKDLKWNITHNIPFSIAMIVEYYWIKDPGLHANVGSLKDRSTFWKVAYNTSRGAGTPEIYQKRVTKFMARLERNRKDS